MLDKIQARFGSAERIWVMDRGIPTEEVLEELRTSNSKVRYLVGTPKGRLTRYEALLSEKSWENVRAGLRVKLLPQEGELYVLAESQARASKERGMRRRSLRQYWKRLGELSKMEHPCRDDLMIKLGKAQERAGRIATSVVWVRISEEGILSYGLDREKLRKVRQREGRYLLRTNMDADDPELLWHCYMQLCHVEEAFRTLKGDLGLRPIFHKTPERIEAHLFVAFLAYCLSITLRQQLKVHATGLMPRTVFEKLSTMHMLDVALPTTDGRELLLLRRTEPDKDVALLLSHLDLQLPPQPPPKIRYPGKQAV
jgi:transposase